MDLVEALYGRKCRTSVCWDDMDERKLLGPKIILISANKVKVIRKKIKIAQDRQKKAMKITGGKI